MNDKPKKAAQICRLFVNKKYMSEIDIAPIYNIIVTNQKEF